MAATLGMFYGNKVLFLLIYRIIQLRVKLVWQPLALLACSMEIRYCYYLFIELRFKNSSDWQQPYTNSGVRIRIMNMLFEGVKSAHILV